MDDEDIIGNIVADRSGFDHDAEIIQRVNTGEGGIIGEAVNVDYDGDDEPVMSVGQREVLNSSYNSFAVSAWVKWDGTTEFNGHGYIVHNNNSRFEGSSVWVLGLFDDRFMWQWNSLNDNGRTRVTSEVVEENIWYHVTGVWDGNDVELYVNGEKAGSKVDDFEMETRSDAITTIGGREYSDGGRFFPGEIESVRIYNRALTKKEVGRLYNLRNMPSQANNLAEKLIGHWSCNEIDYDSEMVRSSSAFQTDGVIATGVSITEDFPKGTGEALLFDEGAEPIVCPDTESLSPVDSVTVAAWVNPTGSGDRTLIGKYNTDENEREFLLETYDDEGLRLWLSDDGSNHESWSFDSEGKVPNDEWTHVAFIYNRDEIKAYINGEEIGSATTIYNSLNEGDANIVIGDRENRGRTYQGKLSGLRLYNRPLSKKEILKIYKIRNSKV